MRLGSQVIWDRSEERKIVKSMVTGMEFLEDQSHRIKFSVYAKILFLNESDRNLVC